MVVTGILLIGVLLPMVVHGRVLPKGHRYSVNFTKDKVYDLSNDITILEYFDQDRSMSRSLKQALPAKMEEVSGLCPASDQERTALSLNLHYDIGDFRFTVPARTVNGFHKRKVLAECGLLHGLTDCAEKRPTDDQRDAPEMWFQWKGLKANCQLSTVLDELKEGKGEVNVLANPLFMIVRLPSKKSSSLKIEMTGIQGSTIGLHGLEYLPHEASKAISSEIESRMVSLVNNKIRNILKDHMKSNIEKLPSLNLSEMMFERET